MKTQNGFYISEGNRKVKFPIVNVGAALDCPSRKWCPFDQDNKKESGRNLCYAQKTEVFRKNVAVCRRRNEKIIRDDPIGTAQQVAEMLANHKTIRLNESSDLADWNIDFVVELVTILSGVGTNVYFYSKAPLRLRNRAIKAGATVLHSERDFVAIKKGEKTDLEMCPGICGPLTCMRCPEGKRTAIIEH